MNYLFKGNTIKAVVLSTKSLTKSQLEQLFCETDWDMTVIDHSLIIAWKGETRSFLCTLCGHLYYSWTEHDQDTWSAH